MYDDAHTAGVGVVEVSMWKRFSEVEVKRRIYSNGKRGLSGRVEWRGIVTGRLELN
jgi:hypothetical protein